MAKMEQNDILFWIAILTFFGFTALDLINAIGEFINGLYIKLGGLFWVIIIGIVFLILNKDK